MLEWPHVQEIGGGRLKLLPRDTQLGRWRLKNGLTLDDVSDLVGYSTAMLSRIERGERAVPPLKRVKIARLLGVRVSDLFPVPGPEA